MSGLRADSKEEVVPVRVTVRGLMVIVALASLCSAVFRVHPGLGCFLFAVILLALSGPTGRSAAFELWVCPSAQ
jgi:hypothetical protein